MKDDMCAADAAAKPAGLCGWKENELLTWVKEHATEIGMALRLYEGKNP